MELTKTYSPSYIKFESYFETIVNKLAELKPKLFHHIDLTEFKIFFEAPISKGKNKGSPRLYSIFNQYLKNSKMKFPDETYVKDVCLALTYDKVKCNNGLIKTPCEIMLSVYKTNAQYRNAWFNYGALKNVPDVKGEEELENKLNLNDTEDILLGKVFKAGYLNKYFSIPDLIMLKDYLELHLKFLNENGIKPNIKDFTNNYKDDRNLSAKAYDTRLRNIHKAYTATVIVKFDLWYKLEKHDIPFESFQECTDFLNSLKPWKERNQNYSQNKPKQKEAKTETETSTSEDPKLRYSTLKEYLVKKFGPVNVKEVDGGFVVDKEWCLKYFLNGGFVNLKTGEKGSWLSLVQ